MRLFADLSNLSALQQSVVYELYVKASNIAGTSGESNVVEYDHRDRVAAPSLSISSLSLNTNTLYIGDNATDAEAFDIYVDGVYATTMTVIYPIAVRCDNGTYSGSTSLNVNGTATVTLSANTNYALPSAISVTNASYTYDSTTGVVVLSNPTGNVSIIAICTFIPQLDAPTNVSVSGTTATFDEVENAESYEFFIEGGVSIGEYPPAPQPPFTNIKIQGEGDFYNCSVLVDSVNITNQIEGYPGTPVTMTVNTSFIVNTNSGRRDDIAIYDSEGGNLVWSNGDQSGEYDITPYLNNGYYVYLYLDS